MCPDRPNSPAMPLHPDPRPWYLIFPASPYEVRSALRHVLSRLGKSVAPDEADTLEIVLGEIFNNITEHGYGGKGGPVRVRVVQDDMGLACSICDCGRSLPERLLPARMPDIDADQIALLPEGGMGWPLVQLLTTNLAYVKARGMNEVSFRIAREPAEAG